MSPITTHVLDTALGQPAAGIAVLVEIQRGDGAWVEVARGTTNADGRISDLLPDGTRLQAATYRLTFDTGGYHRARGVRGFYPVVQIHAQLEESGGHYHIPLLLSPFAYSTYRGS
jgi:5-hydroxyisourate hydrolase